MHLAYGFYVRTHKPPAHASSQSQFLSQNEEEKGMVYLEGSVWPPRAFEDFESGPRTEQLRN